MKKIVNLLAVAAVAAVFPLYGQTADPAVSLQQQLIAQFPLTKVTADRSDIVKAGAVLVLQKDGLTMYSTASPLPPLNTYKHGKLSGSFARDMQISMASPQGTTANDYPHRKFVTGEKFWITGITLQKDGIYLRVFSDPYNDTRYYADLKFPLEKGSIPSPDEALAMLREVVTAEPTDTQAAATPPPAENTPKAPASEAPPPPINAPQPPPKAISIGNTKAQVEAAFGQPEKTVSLGAKEIYYYKDMKITFVNGKVSDVQ